MIWYKSTMSLTLDFSFLTHSDPAYNSITLNQTACQNYLPTENCKDPQNSRKIDTL
jgi:hypothetical protein